MAGNVPDSVRFPLLGLSILAAFIVDRLAPAALKLKYGL